MARFFSILFCSVLFAVSLTSCMSEQERALKNSVDEYASTLPQDVADGIAIDAIEYEPSDSTVTLTCNIENEIVSSTLKHTTGAVKAVFVPYLKTQKADNEMLRNIIAAKAKLNCVFTHAGEEIGSFTVESSEL